MTHDETNPAGLSAADMSAILSSRDVAREAAVAAARDNAEKRGRAVAAKDALGAAAELISAATPLDAILADVIDASTRAATDAAIGMSITRAGNVYAAALRDAAVDLALETAERVASEAVGSATARAIVILLSTSVRAGPDD